MKINDMIAACGLIASSASIRVMVINGYGYWRCASFYFEHDCIVPLRAGLTARAYYANTRPDSTLPACAVERAGTAHAATVTPVTAQMRIPRHTYNPHAHEVGRT